jgi:hypothetical protein
VKFLVHRGSKLNREFTLYVRNFDVKIEPALE